MITVLSAALLASCAMPAMGGLANVLLQHALSAVYTAYRLLQQLSLTHI